MGCPQELPDSLGDCADGTELAWSDVEPVFTAECTTCHASDLGVGDRSGAPVGSDFDTPEAAISGSFLTWAQIQGGRMPPGGTLEYADGLLVWEWLSCGGPE